MQSCCKTNVFARLRRENESTSSKELLSIIPKIVDRLAAPILNEEIDTARLADARNGGRQECKNLRLWQR